jgi:hypothetical protein
MNCIFHIGPPKTGTSAIQRFLNESRERLLDVGCLYPLTGLWSDQSHNGMFLSEATNKRLAQSEFAAKVAALKAEVSSSGLDTVIMSSELASYSVSTPEGQSRMEALFDALETDVHVICFVRQQDALIDSAFKQFVRAGFSQSPWHFVRPRYKNWFFDQLVARWMELSRVKQVSCIAYDGTSATVGLDNFWRVAGLPTHALGMGSSQFVNLSIDGLRLQMKYFFNQLGLATITNRRIMTALDRSGIANDPRITLFNEHARRSLLSIFERSNEILENQFQCRAKPEPTAERTVFEPIDESTLKHCMRLICEADEKVMSRIASELLGWSALRPADQFADALVNRLVRSGIGFQPEHLAEELEKVAQWGI